VHIHDGMTEDDFVTMREQRDAILSTPDLLLPAIQVNIGAGRARYAGDATAAMRSVPPIPRRRSRTRSA